ncbi:MAG: hypothetical protein ACTSSF_05280 [Candidatus Heimdallarchaeaceae archaeon]
MVEKEDCGNYYIYEDEEGWWTIEEKETKKILGKFAEKDDVLEKIAFFIKDEDKRTENESVC